MRWGVVDLADVMLSANFGIFHYEMRSAL
ncbi:MAG: hypothetical protein ACI9VI_003235, partial [Candidatus Azotimanducaceae bacterium]